MGRPNRNASADMAQTAFTGVPVQPCTADQTRERGTPPSRANAHSILTRQPNVKVRVRAMIRVRDMVKVYTLEISPEA